MLVFLRDHPVESPSTQFDIDGCNGDGRPVSNSSEIEESFEVSGVADLDPELQVIKG